MQQKTRIKLMWWNTFGIGFGAIGAIFLGIASVIVLMSINFIRNVGVLISSYYPKTKRWIMLTFGATLVAAITAANIIFWENWLSGMSIALGTAFIIAFLQATPKRMRIGLALCRIPAFVFSILTTNLIQGITELVALISGLTAIIRLDLKKATTTDPEPEDKDASTPINTEHESEDVALAQGQTDATK